MGGWRGGWTDLGLDGWRVGGHTRTKSQRFVLDVPMHVRARPERREATAQSNGFEGLGGDLDSAGELAVARVETGHVR